MLKLWMVWRQLKISGREMSLTLALATLGMSLGVAALIVAMAIFSGYEATLRRSVIDAFGHLVVLKKGSGYRERNEIAEEISKIAPEVQASTPYLLLEAILAHNKELNGIVVEGVDASTYTQVVRLDKHVIDGEFSLESVDSIPAALVGKGIQKKFNLKVGEKFRVVLPMAAQLGSDRFRSKVQTFVLKGVLDLGRHDYDLRYVLTDLSTAQKFAETGDRVSGVRFRLDRDESAEVVSRRIDSQMDLSYFVRTWYDSNRNIFMAASYEKVVIFIIVFLMVVAASFNISGFLYATVLRRFHDISVLKAMGATQKMIRQMFAIQGATIGFVGAILGVFLGIVFCWVFMWVQQHYPLFPAEIYKIDRVDAELRWQDVTFIVFSSTLVCFLASLAPARRGAKLFPVEGLRYE